LVERYPGRILPTPITENGFVGAAGGAAMDGYLRPVVELMYPDFALVAADQIFNQISRARHMYGGDMPMPLVLRTKVAMGTGYGSQHSMDPAGLYANWPGWRIVAPTNAFDYVGLMNSALRCEDPVLVIEHVDLYNKLSTAPVDDLDFCIPLGRARVAREGSKFTVLSYLDMVNQSVALADEHGFDAEVIDLRSLDRAGIDWDTIGESIKKTNNVVIIEQGSQTASYGGNLSDEIQRRFFDYLDQPIKRVVGGEGSPSVSKALEHATVAGRDEILERFSEMLSDQGLPVRLVS
jgi:2-oxoisovalerate dehydrogenase E1 component